VMGLRHIGVPTNNFRFRKRNAADFSACRVE
jgi:hypothetical protein